MGRKYERKTLRKRDANVIKLALIEVTEKQGYLSERRINYNVPRSTLMDYLKRKREGKLDTYVS